MLKEGVNMTSWVMKITLLLEEVNNTKEETSISTLTTCFPTLTTSVHTNSSTELLTLPTHIITTAQEGLKVLSVLKTS